jgi:glutamate-1-semialdehyde 2,1-aminomutase
MKERKKSKEAYEKLCQVIPGGVNSPVRACKEVGLLPIVIDSAKEDTITDLDGNCYIDYCGSWGALIHGHAHPVILEAVKQRMALGTTFGITSSIEEKLASKVIQQMPSIEKIRFVSSGTEATMSAIRLARGFTKREMIVKFTGNYHGHADFLLIKAGSGVASLPAASSAGVPYDSIKNTLCLPFNDIEACKILFNNPNIASKIAAVIIEPVAANMGVVPAKKEFLQILREETKRIGSLLIFDEVITGFRLGLTGAQGIYKITPDLTCLGKIIGGGFPAAAFGGRKEIMDHLAPLGTVYQAGTLSGNPVAMEAGLCTLQLAERPQFYEELEEKTNTITKPVKDLIERKKLDVALQQAGSLFTLFFGRASVTNMEEAGQLNAKQFVQFFHFLLNKGIYAPPSQYEAWFVSHAHTQDHLSKTRDAILEFLVTLKK